ncbi:uncharacterized protein [Periplaneta americana]|uniref:uncharacterized protein n=1 Tax=Periplaneta americana TaxID=6978 RepID=UPI0037E76FE3
MFDGDRMEQLLKVLHAFFTYLIKHKLKWQENMQKAVSPINALCNQAEQFRLVKKFEDSEEDFQLRNKIISKIKSGLEEEMVMLLEILQDCEASNKALKNKLVVVEQSCDVVDTADMLQGTATQPAPGLMLEWAHDAWSLYHAFYLQIFGALKCMNYEDEDTIVQFQKAFKESPEMSNHIQRMIAYTSFFVEGS